MPIRSSAASSTKGAPGVPTIGTATAGDASASVTFTAPSFSKLPITSYTVTASPGGATGTGSSSPIAVSGLTNGTAYTFTVRAISAGGTSAASSASNSATPAAATFALSTPLNGNAGLPMRSGIDSSGNIYATGLTVSTNTYLRRFFLLKTNAAGTVSFAKESFMDGSEPANIGLGGIGSGFMSQADSIVDSYGNVYVARCYGSANGVYVVKYDSSGANQWVQSFYVANGVFADSASRVQLTFDSSEYLFIVYGTEYGQQAIAKIQTSNGAILLSKGYDGSPQGEGEGENPPYPPLSAIARGPYDSMYVCGATRALYGQDEAMYVALLNPDFSVNWQYSWRSATNTIYLGDQRAASDSSGNLYTLVLTNTGYTHLTKINTGGEIQWQKRFTDPSELIGGLAVAPNGTVHVVLRTGLNSPSWWDKQWTWRSYDSSGDELFAYYYSDSTASGTQNQNGNFAVYANNTNVIISAQYDDTKMAHIKLSATSAPSSFVIGGVTFTRNTANAAETGDFTTRSTENIPWTDYSSNISATNNNNTTITVVSSPLTTTKFTI